MEGIGDMQHSNCGATGDETRILHQLLEDSNSIEKPEGSTPHKYREGPGSHQESWNAMKFRMNSVRGWFLSDVWIFLGVRSPIFRDLTVAKCSRPSDQCAKD